MILPRSLDKWLRDFLKRRGYVFMRETNANHVLGRRLMLMRAYGIDLVLDVGANAGQYARRLRSVGYIGSIVSFEPMLEPFQRLCRSADGDSKWTAMRVGLGDVESEMEINVSENSVSSSLLSMLASHSEHAPRSRVVEAERVEVTTLDSLWADGLWEESRGIWLKLDVQGFEDRVLAGARMVLPHVAALQMELSLVPLYDGQLTLIPMLKLLAELGFDPVAFEPGFENKTTGEYLQVDGIF
jgi:FkbM family methyltransferase